MSTTSLADISPTTKLANGFSRDGDGGEWVLNGYNFEVTNDTITNTVNHFAGVYIKDGLVQQFSIYEQQLPKE